MRELKPHELEHVSGSGVVADFINERLEKTFRDLGDNLGMKLGESIFKGLDFITSKTQLNMNGVKAFINKIFKIA